MWNTVQLADTSVLSPDLSRPPQVAFPATAAGPVDERSKSAGGRQFTTARHAAFRAASHRAHAVGRCIGGRSPRARRPRLVAVLAWSASDSVSRRPAMRHRTLGQNDEAFGRLFTPATFPAGTSRCIAAMSGSRGWLLELRALDPAPARAPGRSSALASSMRSGRRALRQAAARSAVRWLARRLSRAAPW